MVFGSVGTGKNLFALGAIRGLGFLQGACVGHGVNIVTMLGQIFDRLPTVWTVERILGMLEFEVKIQVVLAGKESLAQGAFEVILRFS